MKKFCSWLVVCLFGHGRIDGHLVGTTKSIGVRRRCVRGKEKNNRRCLLDPQARSVEVGDRQEKPGLQTPARGRLVADSVDGGKRCAQPGEPGMEENQHQEKIGVRETGAGMGWLGY